MSNTPTDPFLQFAFWTGALALALTCLLAAQTVLLRMGQRRDARREQACIAKWRPILIAASMQLIPEAMPALRRGERLHFLKLWLKLKESLRGEAGEALADVARRLHCDAIAVRLLRKGGAERLLAILVLGHMRERAAWEELQHLAGAPDSIMSIHAFWAMVQIHPDAAAPLTLALTDRDDWPVSQLANILKDAREACAPGLAQALSTVERHRLPRLLQLAEALRLELPATLLAELLRESSVDLVTGALRLAASPRLLEAVRALRSHPDWQVRVQVAKALGRIGGETEIEPLLSLLDDRNWWVRYRAAHALLALPHPVAADPQALAASVAGRYARDMLTQVAAERAAA